MTPEQKAVQAKFDVLAKVFLGRLPVRYEKMHAALALCRLDPAIDANWVELHRLLHSLAGAAGSFGCDALGEQAGLIELLLEDLLGQKTRTAADVEEVARLLNIMQTAS
ncbi:Hpt domain-containing protein [Massilia sp. TWP1-3-3]|uniref:Hpt domain-containing protein n=1 Tax=Massilia sp. TWP1-3-3 TaxID=2804573 RepID=UPI003CFA3E5E